MSYTPKTEEVLNCYIESVESHVEPTDRKELKAEFNRWLSDQSRVPEPQGEPSDIALDDAIAAFDAYPGDAIDHSSRAWQRERMAATLRAARSAR